jgi:pseudouridine synthase
MEVRVQKYLSDKGVCSRREAEELIRRGLVSVNGKILREMGVKVDPEKDKVEVISSRKDKTERKESVIIYKPRGIVSSRIPSEGKTIYELFPQFVKLNIIGRLDKESEGLLLLSNDGVLARAVTGDQHSVEKEYEVRVQEKINSSRLTRSFGEGVELEDGKTLPAKVKILSENSFLVAIKEGRNHQIRRMCEHIRLTAVKLKRLRIGGISLGKLKPGDWRRLEEKEIMGLKNARMDKAQARDYK